MTEGIPPRDDRPEGRRPRFVPDDAWRPSESGGRPPDDAGTGGPPKSLFDGSGRGTPTSGRSGFYSDRLARYGGWATVLGMILLSVVAANVIGIVVSAPALLDQSATGVLEDSYTLALLILLQAIVFIGAVYLVLVRRGATTWREMGFMRGGPGDAFLKGAGYGILFIMLASAVGALQNVLLGIEQQQTLPFDVEGVGTIGRIAIIIGGVVLAPISEEIFFRGYIFRAMASRKGVARGIIYSSLLFGAIHLIRDWPLDYSPLLPIAVASTILALAYHRSRNIWTPIVAHAVNNGFAFTVLFLSS